MYQSQILILSPRLATVQYPEKFLLEKIKSYVEEPKILKDYQFGFLI